MLARRRPSLQVRSMTEPSLLLQDITLAGLFFYVVPYPSACVALQGMSRCLLQGGRLHAATKLPIIAEASHTASCMMQAATFVRIQALHSLCILHISRRMPRHFCSDNCNKCCDSCISTCMQRWLR